MRNNIQAVRWQKNLTLGQLAIKSGVCKSTISYLENDRERNPTVETALRLAKALNVSVEEVFEYERR